MKTRTGFRRIWPILLLLALPTFAAASPDPIGVRELELKVEKPARKGNLRQQSHDALSRLLELVKFQDAAARG